ncbi:MAG TPA: 6-carboxytetrahydropterin synthase [Bacteroidales bacterium]|nr:6-carboxytetrahydropterin synthase [Bacteroidales bacterium]
MAFKIRLTKLFNFEMAHALWGYDGYCSNIHGHSYVLEVIVSGVPLNLPNFSEDGMLIDFGKLKKIVEDNIISVYDHSLVIHKDAPYEVFFSKQNFFKKIIFTSYQPTCENLLIEFIQKLKDKLPSNVKLEGLRLRETLTSWAEWWADDNLS